ncbi:hypothetical protein PHET_08663 [Paragonimus heterotremus]|uniref:Uncharacterized protein n=1 Tax=Paragonimus heterotremus TaxID=100268 RepID=A0A8J4SLK3_9TREM|nr:hypothetical protein PHET_08663 [Paragonimus heterotremus]
MSLVESMTDLMRSLRALVIAVNFVDHSLMMKLRLWYRPPSMRSMRIIINREKCLLIPL